MKRVVVLGCSGSIGRQTLKIIADNPDLFTLVGVSVNNSIAFLNEVIDKNPSIEICCVGKEEDKNRVNHSKVYYGEDGLSILAAYANADIVVNALLGYVGLRPTLAAIKSGNDIAIANKEALVCGGELIKQELRNHPVNVYPIDSEHSAIYQCLVGEEKRKVKRLIITASGGPFRTASLKELETVTKEEALHHPTWSMGEKITIDSATLINKGLEVIEAHYLFNLPYEKISVVIHPESIVHSMVEFIDGSIKAQLGKPTMEVPILYALNGGKRSLKEDCYLDFESKLNLHFEPLDFKRFKAVSLAYEVGKKGGNLPLAYSVSNEIAVHAFLDDKIAFKDIVEIVEEVVNTITYYPLDSDSAIEVAIKESQDLTRSIITRRKESE